MSKVKKFRILKYKTTIKPVLKVKNISKSFDGRPILQNLNINIFPGSINGLLGPNGSGKTTLFNLLLGVLKPNSGEIFAKSTKIDTLPIHERCSKFRIAYVPQRESLFSGLSCEDNIKAIAEITLKNRRMIDEVVERLLSEFTLLDVKKTLARELSGGQKKKLSIARALINDPEILLLDEIFAALDPITIDIIKKHITNLQTTRKSISILISDHIFPHVLDISDNIFLINDGQIIGSGKPQDIIKDADARKAYFGELGDLD